MRSYAGVEAVRTVGPTSLEVRFVGGWSAKVELDAWIGRDLALLAPLRNSEIMATARVAFFGGGVAWGEVVDPETAEGPIDIGGDQLWRLAGEQAGLIMPTQEFRAWRRRHGLSLTGAAEVLGLSRRSIAYYDSGRRPVPRAVMLACEGWDARATRQAA